jgi:hypothetical protein
MPLEPLIGADAASPHPIITDFRIFGNRLVKTFHDQPLIIRQLAPYITPVDFDGRPSLANTTWDDLDDAEIAMMSGESDTELLGEEVITKLPQIYKSANDNIDNWRRSFANRERLPIILTRLREKIKIKEDIFAFRGESTLGINGIVSATGGYDLGPPTGVWDVDTGNNGILNNAQDDFTRIVNYFSNLGLVTQPIDVVLTVPAYNLLLNTIFAYKEGNNLMEAERKLRGGSILVSNNIQASVTDDANTMVGIVRLSGADAKWGLASSGIQQEVYRTGLYTWRYGVREKFNLESLDPLQAFAWMDAIDTTT